MKSFYFLSLLVPVFLGCAGDRDFVVINLASLQGTPPPFNTIEAFINGGEGRSTIEQGGQFVVPLASSGELLRLVLDFPPEFRDQEVSIEIHGLLDGVDVFSGEATAVVGRSDRPANIFVEFCGNETVDSLRAEECDDANNTEGDGCDSNCTVSACGNGIFAPGELCYVPISLPTVGEQPAATAVGDLNKDGNPDLVTTNIASEDISLFLGNGDGTFQDEQILVVGGTLVDTLIGDLNNDTNLDIITTKSEESTIALLLGNGDGTFQELLILNTENPLGIIVAEFFNDDDDLDIAALNNLGSASILLGNGDGTFQPPVNFASAGGALILADLNLDGIPDIAAVSSDNALNLLLSAP